MNLILSQRPILLSVLILTIIGLTTSCMELRSPNSLLPSCPHVLGTWTSVEYDVLKLDADGSSEIVGGFISEFEVNNQSGCQFSGYHTWDNGVPADGGQSYFIGMIDPETKHFTIIEPGTSSRYLGEANGDHMHLVFTHVAPDLSFNLVYGTSLGRGDEEVSAHGCPDITGTWNSSTYSVLEVNTSGESITYDDYTTTLDVQFQDGCVFRAIDAFTDGTSEGTGSAAVAGVIHADGRTISMVEVPRPTELGPIAQITGRLTGTDRLDLVFIGEMSDNLANISFKTAYSKSSTPPVPAACPDITGTWRGGPFEAYRISQGGTTTTVQRTARELVVSEQNDCLISGQNRWAGEDRVMNSEYFVGHMDSASGVITIMELDPHPNDGTTALITNRLLSDGSMLSEYTGYASDGSFAQVFAEVLTKE